MRHPRRPPRLRWLLPGAAPVAVALITAGLVPGPVAAGRSGGPWGGTGVLDTPQVFEGPTPLPTNLPPLPELRDPTDSTEPSHSTEPSEPSESSMARGAYPLYAWPLGRVLGDQLITVNYVDHDPSGAILDYANGAHAYDGHTGTDVTLYNFRLMDQGCPVLAASDGTVAFIGAAAPGAFDRSCTFAWPDDGNWLAIDNGDGTYAYYLHLRAWSMTVGVGEAVQTGQMLGLVGSSGYSTAPHLHFETGDFLGGPYQWRDPYTGPANPVPSLWLEQEPYEGALSLEFVDQGVFTNDPVGGTVFNTSYCDIQEGIQAPVVFGADEPNVNVWVQYRANAGDTFRIELARPNASTYAFYEDVLTADARLEWFWVYWFWAGGVGPADYGSWTLRTYANGELSREVAFEVGAATVYGPRLTRAGRSFRIDGTTQRDTLRTTALSPAVSYALVDAPPEVTLVDSVLTVGATSSQASRSAFFQVVATDAGARADTAWYHLVDMGKPLEPPVSSVDEGLGDADDDPVEDGDDRRSWVRVAPNPAGGPVEVWIDAGGNTTVAGPVEAMIFDALGRRVKQIVDRSPSAKGVRRLVWDRTDDQGRTVGAGIYFAEVRAGGRQGVARIVVSP